MSVGSIKKFGEQWNEARKDPSDRGYSVSYAEVKQMEQTLAGPEGKISDAGLKALAEQINQDTFLTGPAQREVRGLFEAQLGTDHPFDAVTKEAVKADFAMRAASPFKALAVPGRELKSDQALGELPKSVTKALGELEVDPTFSWESSEVRKANLAGQDVLIVHYLSDEDPEAVRIFTPSGREIAKGGIDDAMAGFFWER